MKNRNFKKGDKIRVIANVGSHDYEIGEIYEITNVKNSNITAKSLDGKFVGNNLYFNEVELVALTVEELKNQNATLENEIVSINKEIVSINKEIKLNNDRIAWMEANGIEEYDENQFKVFQTLTLLEDESLSKIEKAKLIGDLVNQ